MKSTTISQRFEFMHQTASFSRDHKMILAEYSFLCLNRTAKHRKKREYLSKLPKLFKHFQVANNLLAYIANT